eukprot:TRINITY_DN70690_c0_g1_i1.p2 TRINITY_DN70690_c0_g1~~TRINITY_DN70690_c0_g1_i1.p2  ORF type:complete len:144 (-),score=22.73 TRINITY_DN70690_c0_g1_i1:31-462(-)
MFFFSSRRRHTRCREVSWARRCVQETGIIECMIKYKVVLQPRLQPIGQNQQNNENLLQTMKRENKRGQDYINIQVDWMSLNPEVVGSNPTKCTNTKGCSCLLYTSDAADDTPCVDLGGRRFIKKKKSIKTYERSCLKQIQDSE